MKTTRRSFLSKVCGLLPLGVGLSLTGDSGASEGQHKRRTGPTVAELMKCRDELVKKRNSHSRMAEFYELYDFKTNTQKIFERGKVIDERTYDQCPFVLFGQTEEKVKSGEITFLVQKKIRFI